MIKQSVFKEIGLNENEVIVYNLLLDYGEIAPPKISELTSINRQNAYAVIKSLLGKGLVEEIDRRKKLTYRPLHPEKLVQYAENRRKEAEIAEEALKTALPELSSLYHLSTNKPGITFFEGLDGVKKIYEDILKEKPEELLVFRSPHDKEKLDQYLVGYMKRREKVGVKTRIISPTKITAKIIEEDKNFSRTRKYIPENIFHLNTQISIYNDQVAFIAFEKKLMGFVISSKDVAQTLRTIFELVWDR